MAVRIGGFLWLDSQDRMGPNGPLAEGHIRGTCGGQASECRSGYGGPVFGIQSYECRAVTRSADGHGSRQELHFPSRRARRLQSPLWEW